MSQGKGKPLHDNLKQASDGSKTGEFNASKGWFNNFKKRFGFFFFFNVKTIGGEPDAECAGLFPNAIKTSSQMPLRMSLRRMDVFLNSFFFFF